MGKKKVINEHMLWDFVLWVQSGASGKGGPPGGAKTLEYVAQGVDRFIAGKKPWLSSRGRGEDHDSMWLYFHLVNSAGLPRHSQREGRAGKRSLSGFAKVEGLLRLGRNTSRNNYYRALNLWKIAGGRREYINWINHREKMWEVYQASKEKREPVPGKYSVAAGNVGVVQLFDYLENDVKKLTVSLAPKEFDSLLKEAQKRLNDKDGKEDYDNWLKYRNTGMFLVPHKAGRKCN